MVFWDERPHRLDTHSGLVHTVTGTAANVADIVGTHALLHGEEKHVFADAGYAGVEKREELAAQAGNVKWYVAMKRGERKAMAEGVFKEASKAFEKAKAQVRRWWSTRSHILKNLFKHRKTRYRELSKNTAQLHTLFALVNLVIAKQELLVQARG